MNTVIHTLMSRATSRLYPGNVTKATNDEAPLDLSWAHTSLDCERFFNQEDLRPEECEMCEDEPLCSPVTLPVCHQEPETVVTSDRKPRDHNSNSCQKHPFSIESIVGKQTLSAPVPDVTQPARVFRRHEGTSNLYGAYFQSFYETSFNVSFNRSGDSYSQNKDQPKFGGGVRGTEVFWCHVCNEFCTSGVDATRHQIGHRVRGSVAKLQRSIFQQHGYVTSHEHNTSENTVRCGLCKKDVTYCFFSKHQQLHNGHLCDVCHREFSTNSKLQDHMNIHTGSASFVCHVCDRKFAKKSSLTQHKRYHRDYQAFQCQFCSKQFSTKYACAVHERRHTGYNPYVCDVPGCKRAYPQKIQLKLHQISHRHVSV